MAARNPVRRKYPLPAPGLSRRDVLRAALVGGLAVGAGACAPAGTPRSVFVMARALDDVAGLDPAEVFEFSGAEIVSNLYPRLFRADPHAPGAPVGEAAESWTHDGPRFLFTVRRGLKFASGREAGAADAVFSLRRAIALNKAPAFILTQFGLTPERVRLVDERRFALELDAPWAPSLVRNALSAGVASVVDRRAIPGLGGDWGNGWLRAHSAGGGAFALKRWRPGEFVLLDAAPGAAFALKRVALRDIREPAVQSLLLERGDIDAARNLGPDRIAALAAAEDVKILAAPRARIHYLGLNQRHPLLSRSPVRRALRYLIDYRAIAEDLLGGRARVHQAFLPAGFFAALEDTPFAFDPRRARALLREAGLADGFAARVDVRSDPGSLLVAQAIQASMAAGGVRLELVPGTGKQVLTRYRARRHDIFMGQWGADYLDPHSNASVFARNPDNTDSARERTLAWRNGWEIPALTRRAERAALAGAEAERAELYLDLQRTVQRDSPFVAMFQETEQIALRRRVSGFAAGLTSDQTRYGAIRKS